jgi:riboflavin synthase
MFTGIIETIGEITERTKEGSSVHFRIKSAITPELKIDQSVSHNGVCLTVVKTEGNTYLVTAIQETLQRSTLGKLKSGDKVNLERAMSTGTRLDGHMVQGHVDQTAEIIDITAENGSWKFSFKFEGKPTFLLVDKGSVCIDGVSLTVVKAGKKKFSVAIIPYTYEHTIFHTYKKGDTVNIEFDIIGKYVQRMMDGYKKGK